MNERTGQSTSGRVQGGRLRGGPPGGGRSALGAAGALAAVLALTGCGLLPGVSGAPASAEGAEAARFVACLKAGGVPAKIGEGIGMVFVSGDGGILAADGEPGTTWTSPAEEAGIPEGSALLMGMADAQGDWIAVSDAGYFRDLDPGLYETYAACEEQHPDFAQPEFDPMNDPMIREQLRQQEAAGLAFARCARDAGFTWVADPTEDSAGGIALPADLTEGEFRDLLAACPEEAAAGLSWMIDKEPGFDWWAVWEEIVGPASGGGASVRLSSPEEE